MRITHESQLPSDCATVSQALTDPVLVAAKAKAIGTLSEEYDINGDATGPFTVTITRSMATDRVPSAFRALAPAKIDVRQAEAWEAPDAEGARTGTVSVEIAGAPVRLTGTMSLKPTPEGSVLAYDGELKASIPVVGGSIEKAAAPYISRGLDAERGVLLEYLKG